MIIVNRKPLMKATRNNHQLQRAIERWERAVITASWNSILDLRQTFPTADFIKDSNLTCFDVLGNQFRLVAMVSYQRQEISIIDLVTHKEYDRKY